MIFMDYMASGNNIRATEGIAAQRMNFFSKQSICSILRPIYNSLRIIAMIRFISSLLQPFLWVLCLVISLNLAQDLKAQGVPDVSTINVDQLSDAQIMELMGRARAMGYSEAEFFQLAQAQGLPAAEIAKLEQRLNQMNASRISAGHGSPGARTRGQFNWEEIYRRRQETLAKGLDKAPLEERIFGYKVFSGESKISFEPSLNIATPKNYVLGPGDEIYIDIYGASEQYYEARINTEGKLMLQNIGPIPLTGLTIEQATERIRTRLISVYPGMAGPRPNTFLQVSLGTIRTVKINMVGEVKAPGTYTVSSFATVLNALYLAGGPTINGTLRDIKVFRNNRLVSTVDAYEFLIQGKTTSNVRLEDQDVIVINPFTARVEIEGEVKRPGIFEIKEGESFADLLNYAGGFTDNAYTERVNVTRNTATEKVVSDIFSNQFTLFTPKGGDVYWVGEILNRFQNRVQVQGAVFREGNYAITEGLTVSELVKRADGLRGDAYLKRALIIRTKEDLNTESIAFDLGELLKGGRADIVLQRDDVLIIPSIYDLREEYYVKINGEVNNAGVFPYSQNMTVEDLILLAKGFRESASASNIEITRRVKDQNARDISDILVIKVNSDLSLSDADRTIVLEPFDHITVRPNPNFKSERFVKIEGEVFYPGEYAIKNVNEKISDVIKRAGGLNEFAYAKGATLIRYTEFFERDSELNKKRMNLARVLQKIDKDQQDLTEAERMFIERLDKKLFSDNDYSPDSIEGLDDLGSFAKQERLKEISQRNPLVSDVGIREYEAIGINLEEILKSPGSKYDLILEEGDVISIPKQLQTVRMRGRVLYPTTVRYESGKSMKYFIGRAGGFDVRAKRGNTYVIYANGEVARTKHVLFIRNYPNVEPGAEVIVPTKPPKFPLKPGEILGMTTSLATLILVLTQINF